MTAFSSPLATHDEVEGLYANLESNMSESGFLNPAQPGRLMPKLRRLFGRVRAINASQVYRQWVERNHLEPGNLSMASGLLYTSEECKNPVARVWDNGNVFSMAGEKLYGEGEQS